MARAFVLEKLPRFPYPSQVWIQKVDVSSDGTGSMVLEYRVESKFVFGHLDTTDYGVHWAMK